MEMNLHQPDAVVAVNVPAFPDFDASVISRNIERYIEVNKLECGVSNMIARPIKVRLPIDPDSLNKISIPVEITLTINKPAAKKKPVTKKST